MYKKIRRRYIFRGDVQGVGFRYRAVHGAQMLGLTGWVCNMYDGSVLMQVQGDPDSMDELVKRINMGTYININDIEIKELPIEEDERGFHVRREC